MTRRGRRAVLLVAGIVAALFAGRWLTTALADVWWGGTISPDAARFLLRIHVTRGLLDAAGVVLASLWFGFHLVVVFRAIGAVQVPRHLANVEFREALTPRVLLLGTLALGVLLGLVVGTSASELWDRLHLAWHGVAFGVTDPVLGRDLGFYVAQLPLRLALYRGALVLVLLALAGTLTLYIVIGAVRWIDRRPALNGHARAHLGWLLATLAAVLACGYSLHPAEVVAGLAGAPDAGVIRAARLVAPALVGTALMVAVLSALWAVRPRHLLALAAWLVLLFAWLGGRVVVPAAFRAPGDPVLVGAQLESLLSEGFGVHGLEMRDYAAADGAPAPIALWTDSLALRAAGTTTSGLAASRFLAPVGGARRPAWALARRVGDRVIVSVLVDDRVTPAGAPLFYPPDDTLAHPLAEPWLELEEPLVRPGAARYLVGDGAPGARAGSWLRRATLAWALQAPGLLARTAPDSRVAWRLAPRERLDALAPYAVWSDPLPYPTGGDRLVWLLHGTVSSEAFPLVPRVRFRGSDAGLVRSSLVATVDAVSGDARVYLRPDADPLSRAWAGIAAGTVEPWDDLDPALRDAAGYPAELFAAQATALAEGPWVGQGAQRLELLDDTTAVAVEAWGADTDGPVLTAAFISPGQRRLGALLVGSASGDTRRLELLFPDSAATLLAPLTLANRWTRFPLFEQLQDSVRSSGDRLILAPVRFWLGGDGLGAYRAHFGTGPGGRPALVWLSIAQPDRLAAGRDEPEALDNLSGIGVPAPFAAPGLTPLDEARRWMRVADSALRRGDLDEFARAWEGLRATLEPRSDSAAE